MREKTNKILKTLCIYMLVISMMLSSLVGSWDVMAAGIAPNPTITLAAAGSKEVKGGGLIGANRRRSQNITTTIYVTVKNGDTVIENASTTIESTDRASKGWTVNLQNTLVAGYTVYVKQQCNNDMSDEVSAVVKETLASKHKDDLKMPSGDLYLENTNASLVSADEAEELLGMVKAANPSFANDIASVKLEYKESEPHGTIVVTYTDDTNSGKINADNLNLVQITETSRGYTLEPYNVVSNKIVGKVDGEGPFNNISVRIVMNIDNDEKNILCKGGTCKIVKSTASASPKVDPTTGTFEYDVKDSDLVLGKKWGIIVKEPRKFANCDTSVPEIATPDKIAVKDPKKITDAEKKTIEAAIRAANTTSNGTSKLPDGTGSNVGGAPAIIEISDDGKVKIISPNDVDVNDWDNDGNPIYPKNPDGTVKVSSGKENNVINFDKPGELLSNLAPDAPDVKVDGGNVIVTPNKADTDARTVEVTYTGKDGASKTVTATKGQDGTWTTDDPEVKVDDKGVVTLPTSKVKSNTTVTAKVTDDGGIAQDDKDKKSSEAGTITLTASVQTPTVTVDETTGDVTVTPKDNDADAKRLFITYTPAKGTEKTVEAKKGNDDKWSITGESDFVASDDGKSFTIKNTKVKANTEVKAITKGETDDVKSDTAQAEVPDKTAPKSPNVKVDDKTGNVTITPPTDEDLKKVEVEYIDPTGAKKTATATKDGETWTISGEDGVTVGNDGVISIPYENVKKGTDISAKAYDNANNDSKPDTNTQLPPPPTVTPNTDTGIITVAPPTEKVVDGVEITYTPANSAETKTIKVKKGNDSKWTIEGVTPEGVTIDDNGLVTFAKGTAKENTKVIAISKIGELKGLDKPDGVVPDKTAPEAPAVKVQDDGSVTITPKEGSDTKTVTVTYKDNEGNNKTAIATKGDDNKWSVTGDNGETIDETTGVITIPTGKSNPGDVVKATAKDANNNESGPSNDTTKPAPPTVTPDQKTGNVTITPPTKGNLDGMDIEYKTPDNTDRKVRVVKGTDNKWKIEGENPDVVTVDEGTGLVTIPQGKAKENTEVKADSTLGDKKAPAEKTPEKPNLVPDKTAPNPPTVAVDTETGNVTITPPSDEDTTKVTVTYKDENDEEKTAIATKANGNWTIVGSNEETVDSNGVITIPKGKYKTGEAVTAYGNDNVDNKSTDGKDTPVEVSFNGDSGSIGSMESKILSANGKYKLPANGFTRTDNKTFKGWQVGNESELRQAGDEIEVKADVIVKAVWEDVSTPQPPAPNPNPNPDPTPNPPQNVKNPSISVDLNGNLVINPPTEGEVTSVTVNYKDTQDAGKTLEVKKDEHGNWTIENNDNGETVDSSSGVITIPRGKYKLEEPVKAVANSNQAESGEATETPVEVTFDKNGGSKDIEGSILVKGGSFVLPEIFDKQFFPAGKEFAGWQVGSETKKAGDSITINGNTTIKALWKNEGTEDPGTEPGTEPGVKSNQDSHAYNPWWPIWFGSSDVKPAEPKVEYERGLHRKYLYGYKDHTVRPEGLITRAEAAALIARLAELNMSDNSKPNFKDTLSAWYNTAINAVLEKNLMFADKDGDFRPNEPITRGEFARALFFIDKKNNAVAPFADVKGHVYEEAINQAYGNDRIKGYPDGTFKPDATITRAEAATILNHYADRNVTFKGLVEVHKDVIKFIDLDESHWAYYEIMEAANSHDYQREKGTIPEDWQEVLEK